MQQNMATVPSFVYRKHLGDAVNIRSYGDHFDGVRGICLYTVRCLPMGLIGGSTLVGKLTRRRFQSFEGDFGTRFSAYLLKKLQKLDDILYEPEALTEFEPEIWYIGGMSEGIIAFQEEDAVVAAYEYGFRALHESEFEKRLNPYERQTHKPWRGLFEYQKRKEHSAA